MPIGVTKVPTKKTMKIGIRNSPIVHRESIESRTKRRCGPLSRAGRYRSSPRAMPWRMRSRCLGLGGARGALRLLAVRRHERAPARLLRLAARRGRAALARSGRRRRHRLGGCLLRHRASSNSCPIAYPHAFRRAGGARRRAGRIPRRGRGPRLPGADPVDRVPRLPGRGGAAQRRGGGRPLPRHRASSTEVAVHRAAYGDGLLGNPAVLAVRPARARPPDRPALRPPRRPARRPRRALGRAAVRADARRRAPLRPRRLRRQGRRRHPPRRPHRRVRRARRRPRRRRRALHRGGGGGRLPVLRRLPRRAPRRARGRRDHRGRLRQRRHRHPGADLEHPRQRHLRAHGRHPRARVALRHARRSGPGRDARDHPAARRRCGTTTGAVAVAGPARRARRRGADRLDRGAARATTPACCRASRRSDPGSVADRLWRGPAITVTGIDAPDVRNASNTLQPSVRVRISVRVAPGQRAADAFAAVRSHLEQAAPFGAHLDFADVDLGEPFRVDQTGWGIQAVRQALEDGWGARPGADRDRRLHPVRRRRSPRPSPRRRSCSPASRTRRPGPTRPNESQHLGVLRRVDHAPRRCCSRPALRGVRCPHDRHRDHRPPDDGHRATASSSPAPRRTR